MSLHTLAVRHATLIDRLVESATAHPERIAVRALDGSLSLTWSRLRDEVARVASGLEASGIQRGHAVAALLGNRPEFIVLDLAAISIGAVTVAIGPGSSPGEVSHLLRDSGARLVLTESALLAPLSESLAGFGSEIAIEVVDDPTAPGLARIAARGGDVVPLERRARSLAADDVAALVYTSGSTGPAKGVELTHDNIAAACEAVADLDPAAAEAARVLSYLPVAHIGDRLYGYWLAVFGGGEIVCVPSFGEVLRAVGEVRPTVFVGVPRVWEKLRAAIVQTSAADPVARRAAGLDAGLDPAALLLSGSAPIDPDVLGFFDDLGVPVLEGYGMTEATCVITCSRRGQRRGGSVGTPARGVEVRIADDGEVLVRGRVVMAGYRGRADADNRGVGARGIDADGWLHTGDLGVVDGGFLSLVGRKSDMIITATGKNIAPARFEDALRSACALVADVVVVGDRRPYLTALITTESASDADAVEDEIARAIDTVNTALARPAQVRRFAVVGPPWQADSGLLTASGKVRRAAAVSHYAEVIDAMYGVDAAPDSSVTPVRPAARGDLATLRDRR